MAGAATPTNASPMPAHTVAYVRRRVLNWFPLGLAYAFLYMGRYNLNVAKTALGQLMTTEDFGWIFGAGTLVYGVAFLINGPLTDVMGGRKAMLVALTGSGAANLAMGLYLDSVVSQGSVDSTRLRLVFSLLYGINMYFQSFGAVAIVKVNSAWFHVRERGSFSGIFGTMISSGIFLAYTVNAWILDLAKAYAGGESETLRAKWVFFAPFALLTIILVVEFFLLRDRPSQAGHEDFDTGDASSGEPDMPFSTVFVRILKNPVILTIAFIEFCTGVVRQGVMQSYPFFAAQVLGLPRSHYMRDGSWGNFWVTVFPFFVVAAVLFFAASRSTGRTKGTLFSAGGLVFLLPFLQAGWGGLLFVAGVIGANVAGYVSDLFFHSRRAPAAGGLYGALVVLVLVMPFVMGQTNTTIAELQDAKKTEGLQVGDKVVEVAGRTDLKDWVAVREAFAAVRAKCKDDQAQWDSELYLCSTSPKKTDPSLPVSTGVIPMVVERNGTRVEVSLKDPAPALRAGDRRSLAATPEATPNPIWLGALVFLMSLAVIGTHGLLSGTASQDFGGKKGTATAVGLIDGFVYLGSAVQSVSLGYLTGLSWSYWPWFLLPFSVVGFVLCLRIWNAAPKGAGGGH